MHRNNYFSGKIVGVGSYVPSRLVSNIELSNTIDTSDEWIYTRTGIRQRYLVNDGVCTSDLAYHAAKKALNNAGISPCTVDLVIVATTTPDHILPATATKVQSMLGISHGIAFDIQAVCAGFIFALVQANNMIRLEQSKRALVIGAEIYSRILNWKDRSTCILFGDGAGAVVLTPSDSENFGIIGTHIASDGRFYEKLCSTGGIGSTGTLGVLTMDGKDVFRHAIHLMYDSVCTLLQKYQLSILDIDYLVPHQANKRIIDLLGAELGISPEKVISTIEYYANTSAASIPMALAKESTRFKRGDRIVLVGMGAGFCWGSVMIVWS